MSDITEKLARMELAADEEKQASTINPAVKGEEDNEKQSESPGPPVPEINVEPSEAQNEKTSATTSTREATDDEEVSEGVVVGDKEEEKGEEEETQEEREGEEAPPAPTLSKLTSLPMKTPAPPRTSTLIPDAPAPKPIPKDLPHQTPAGSATPTSYDISEFDPYATPALISGSSTSHQDGRRGIVDETPVPGPSTTPSKRRDEHNKREEIPRTPSQRLTSTNTSTSTRTDAQGDRRGGDVGQVREGGEESGGVGAVGEPVFNFSGFLKDIKSKPADPIARYLKRSVNSPFPLPPFPSLF